VELCAGSGKHSCASHFAVSPNVRKGGLGGGGGGTTSIDTVGRSGMTSLKADARSAAGRMSMFAPVRSTWWVGQQPAPRNWAKMGTVV